MLESSKNILNEIKKRFNEDRKVSININQDGIENINSRRYSYVFEYVGKSFMNSPDSTTTTKQVNFEIFQSDASNDFKFLQKQIESVEKRKDFNGWV